MEKKKQTIYAEIALLALALLVVGATYAYFQNQYGESSQTDVKVTTYTTDLLTFETGDPINITADQETFGKDKGNQTGSSFAKAILQANNKTKLASMNYNLYLLIENNEFSYTLNDEKPELILNITDSNGTSITIDSLTQKTVTDAKGNNITGYDITLSSGLITLLNNKTIEVVSSDNGEREENWDVTLTLVNYDFDQNNNAGKSFNAKLIIQKEVYPTVVGDVCNNGDNLAGCVATLSNKGGSLVTNVYHHDGTIKDSEGNILDAEDGSYRYAGFEHDNLYSCKYNGIDVLNKSGGSYFVDKNLCNTVYKVISSSTNIKYYGNDFYSSSFGNEVAISWNSASNKCVTENGNDVNFYASGSKLTKEFCNGNATLINNKYYSLMKMGSGVSKLVKTSTLVNNYVCFGSEATTCPDDNLYRIIGSIGGKIKLIKADLASSNLLGTDGDYSGISTSVDSNYRGNFTVDNMALYYFNYNGLEDKTINGGKGSGDWSTSLLNTVNLNTNFLNNIGSKWANLIVPSSWKFLEVSSASSNALNTIKGSYTWEAGITGIESKVGILNKVDYGYSSIPTYWNLAFSKYHIFPMFNWISLGIWEWALGGIPSGIITPLINTGKFVGMNNASNGLAVRPVFYLDSNVEYSSGKGTSSDPIRLVV